MDIGILRAYDLDWTPEEVRDLEDAIRSRGHSPKRVYVDLLRIDLGKGIKIRQQIGHHLDDDVTGLPGAVLRHMGTIRDFEQFHYRIWAAKAMERAGTVISNPVDAWVTAGDKFATGLELARQGLPVPPTTVTENIITAYWAAKELGPMVVKPLRSAMGYGVAKIDDADEAMHFFSFLTNISKPILIQKYMEKAGGGDYRVVVVNGQAIGAEFRRGTGWKSNVAQGATPLPARLGSDALELAVKATEALGLDYAGVDLMETREGFMILEVNPTMAWAGFKRATGINPAGHIVDNLIRKIKR
ncbi:RimK family alpha-L-glutamate ligase [Thermocladium modestius]|uniref:RimK family alpha-L-glutamate ligase n=1 Tax=Thermocladium modestius TaxID=62609 RepID=A0A830GRV2_9CREN|nr:RimK family alpha-L-glutamate ligase [Thermocladium modestius]GGP19257.1 RimK family alpha-L-glutamate ligase [Thermocladium modestius]